jgi:hypothetical protein
VNAKQSTNVRKLKSYVWHGEQCFFVSTIERDSSAASEPPPRRFHETIVWEYDWETTERGEMVAQDGSHSGLKHFEICKQIYLHGKYDDDD